VERDRSPGRMKKENEKAPVINPSSDHPWPLLTQEGN